jgi:leucyl aminopeptidase (aminopeptidase T)
MRVHRGYGTGSSALAAGGAECRVSGAGPPSLARQGLANASRDHLDVSIGSDEVSVTGYDRAGHEQLLLDAGRWQF